MSPVLIAMALAVAISSAATAAPPQRVVSMNLCADQLALMIGAPGQVISVSSWSQRPSASNTAAAAALLPANQGQAEHIFAMRPDLVLAGRFTNRASVDMLRRLGVPVAILPGARSFQDVETLIAQVGEALGRPDRAASLIADFRAALAAARAQADGLPLEDGAWRYANNFTSGADTLAAAVMDAGRLRNAAAGLGLTGAARIDLETLVMTEPFLLQGLSIAGAEVGRAYEGADHPALRRMAGRRGGARLPERLQVCGTPYVAQAVALVVRARRRAAQSGASGFDRR